jgi:hypothetical protein
MKPQHIPVSRKDNLVIQELEKEVLIYDLKENKAYCLNETSALVWQACDGKRSVAEISKFVGEKLNLPANEDIVWFALDQLKKEYLIDNGDTLPNQFDGLSRREIVKKVGLGTLVALPIVASLIAPAAAQAQTQNCLTCTKFNQGDVCSPFCANKLGTCYENAGCGGGQSTGSVTCLACSTPVANGGLCQGGPSTCSWKQP